jgi:ATP-binding cassette subfamily B protein
VFSAALRRFLPYLRPHARLMAIAVVGCLGSLTAATAIPLAIKAVIDGPIGHRDPGQLLPLGSLLVGLAAVELASNFLRRNFSWQAAVRMEYELRNDFYAHLQGLQVAFHDNWQSGQLLSRAVADIQTVRRFVATGVVFAAYSGAQWVAVFAVLLRLEWHLALLSGAVVLPVGLITRHFFRRYVVIARRVQDQQGDMTTVIEEMATGVRIIKAFGRNRHMRDRFQHEARRLRETNLEGVRTRGSTWSLFGLVINLDLCAILLLGGVAVMGGDLTIGGLVAFMSYLFMLVWTLDGLGWTLALYEEATTASMRLAEVFDSQPQIVDRPGARRLPSVRGHIRFEGVWFRYPGVRNWVLRGLELEVDAGETLALVGSTGSGKSTLAALVPRLYDVTRGRVIVDGTDVRDLQLRSLRSQIAVAFEDPILFSASVRENLVMGRPITSDAELRRALELARAEFVWDLPWGLETRVGEQGYSLSGGQRQRLALARAVLGSPRILVLDDPLSAVDVHTEREIEEALASVLREVTALLVVHRPSTLALANRVALLEGGRIVAVGTHGELMRSSGLYRSLLAERDEGMEGTVVA